jgi:hypothetical protein
MGSRKTRLVALLIGAVGAVGMVGVTTGPAQAVTLNRVSPAYPDNASCTSSRNSFSALPDVAAAAACSYYSTADPQTGIPSPGWYFRYALAGDGACGIGCHTPPPPPPCTCPVIDPSPV